MKNLFFFLIFVTSILFVSCIPEDEENKTPSKCTLTLYANGGSMTEGESGSTTIKKYTVNYTGKLRLPSADDLGLTYEGFQFSGWSKTAIASESEYNATQEIQLYSDVSLYAVWNATGTKTFYISEGGSDSSGDGSVAKPYASFSKAIELVNSEYVDYIFIISGSITVNTVSLTDGTFSWVKANSISIKGKDGAETDSLNGAGSSALFTIATSVPVSFSNISMKGGKGFLFAGNKVGGAVFISSVSNGSTNVSFSSVVFCENSADYGAALYNITGTVIITDCTFNDNTAAKAGGAIYNEGIMTLKNSTVSSNVSEDSAGGLYSKGTITLSNSVVSENVAENKGAGLYNAGKATLTASSRIEKNECKIGAGVYNATAGTFILESGKIFENKADTSGAGVYNEGTSNMTGGTIADNELSSQESYGTGIYNSGVITLSGVTLKSHNANTCGAALYNDDAGTVFFSGSSVTENSSKNGGAFYNSGTMTISGGEITGNSAAISGGAIYSIGTLIIKKCDIQNNTAKNGGAIALYGEESSCNFSYGTVAKNEASNGGGVYIADGASLDLSVDSDYGCAQIIDNVATSYGGGVYLSLGELNVEEGVVSAYGKRISGNAYGGSASYYSGNKAGENKSTSSAELYSDSGNSWFCENGTISVAGQNLTGNAITIGENTYSYSDDDVVVGVSDWAAIQ